MQRCLPACLPVPVGLSVYLCLSASLSLSVSQSVCLSVYLSVCLSASLSPSISQSICQSVCLSASPPLLTKPACLPGPQALVRQDHQQRGSGDGHAHATPYVPPGAPSISAFLSPFRVLCTAPGSSRVNGCKQRFDSQYSRFASASASAGTQAVQNTTKPKSAPAPRTRLILGTARGRAVARRVLRPLFVSTRILGRRTAPIAPFLIPHPRPTWFCGYNGAQWPEDQACEGTDVEDQFMFGPSRIPTPACPRLAQRSRVPPPPSNTVRSRLRRPDVARGARPNPLALGGAHS